jgi:hypothetical protein
LKIVFVKVVVTSVNCGGDYSLVKAEGFLALLESKESKTARFQAGRSRSSGNHPPFCSGGNQFGVGVNEITDQCDVPCPDGFETHFFSGLVHGKETDLCCCGECS